MNPPSESVGLPRGGEIPMYSEPQELPGNSVLSNRTGRAPSSRTPQPDNPRASRNAHGYKKSTLLAIYLYHRVHNKLEDKQNQFIANFQRKMYLSEVLSSLEFLHKIETNPRIRARLRIDSVKVPFYHPRPRKRRDQRRIGVGYRDKGSLPKRARPDWNKDNTLNPGESEAQITKVWDLTILFDNPSEESEDKEPTEDIVGQGGTLVASFYHNNSFGKISNPSGNIWIISGPNNPSRE